MARRHRFQQEQHIPRPRPEVFAFFADAGNLERLTPPALRLQILTPLPIRMEAGALIEYRLRLYGLPFVWQTRIETFDPDCSFSDVQLGGPYRHWHHRHEFVVVEGGTLVKDTVDYELPLGWLGELGRPILVTPALEKLFAHRRRTLEALFGAASSNRSPLAEGGG